MIKYDTGGLGLGFILRIKGSVFPKAFLMALPNAIGVLLLHRFARFGAADPEHFMAMEGVEFLWAGYTSVLSFLIVFRNNQAYTRFWEGATLIHQVRGEWFNAVSGLFAFCNKDEHKREHVEMFQHTLIRLASLLHCSALQQVCDLGDDIMDVIGIRGIDPNSFAFMQESNDRCEVIMQWIQRLIVEADAAGTIKIAPPVLSRVFQEFSRGIVHLNNARKIKEIPFPFPYAQLITSMLLVHWVATPVIASQVIKSFVAATAVCFFVTFVLWCLVFIVTEIDQPFGEDPNDLPIQDMQKDMNRSLMTLMNNLAQTVPDCTRDLQRVSRVLVPIVSTPSDHIVAGLTRQNAQISHAQEVEDMLDACSSGLRQNNSEKREKKGRSRSKEFGSTVAPTNSRWYDVLKPQIKPAVFGQGRARLNIDPRSEDARGHTSDREISRQSEDSRGPTSDRDISRQSQETATTAPRSDAGEHGGGGGGASHGQLKPAVLGRTESRGRSSEQESTHEAPRSDTEEDPGSAGAGGNPSQPTLYTSENSGGPPEILAARSAAPSGETLAVFGQEADLPPARQHLLQLRSDPRLVMQSF